MNQLIQSWKKSKGPDTAKDRLTLFGKGFAMGTADVIPGVSGGTIAFITGIYDQLVGGISSVNTKLIRDVLLLKWSRVLESFPFKFFVFLGLGVVTAIFSTARLMHFLISDHPIPTWSFFFGLIAASILIVGKEVDNRYKPKNIFLFIIGGLFAYLVVGMIPLQTPNEYWFYSLAGALAICAMILPGISGSFLLLILGKYAEVTGAIKNPFTGDNFLILLSVLAGQFIGILSFSKVLNFLYTKYRSETMTVLCGMMAGSLRKIWPWKETLETVEIRGKMHILREANRLPNITADHLYLAAFLMIAGLSVVLLLQAYSDRIKTVDDKS